jgi:hypothetical protein
VRSIRTIDKRALIALLRDDLRGEIAVMTRAANDAREAATHEEARPENDKDTRAVEAAYLAGAQAERVRELERVMGALGSLELLVFGPGDPIAASAVVHVDVEGARHHYLLAPHGGGLRAEHDGVMVQVITLSSPIGQALLHKSAGDVVELSTPRGKRECEILEVW